MIVRGRNSGHEKPRLGGAGLWVVAVAVTYGFGAR